MTRPFARIAALSIPALFALLGCSGAPINDEPTEEETEAAGDASPDPNYKGDAVDGMKQGFGRYVSPVDGSTYEGEWVKDRKNGKGTFTEASGAQYVGQWKDDRKHGKGTYRTPDGTTYTGDWKNDGQTGQGTLSTSDGSKYKGGFLNGKKDGKGVLQEKGKVYDGYWKDDEFLGKDPPR
jgi:hypothetical protein